MDKIIKIIRRSSYFLSLLIIVSCTSDNDVEPLFDGTINERTEALRNLYTEILTEPENGWIGYYSPNQNFGAYAMLMNFDEDGSVSINSDYEQGNEDNTITYRIDKTLKVELVLESFAVFHKIFEVNNNNNGGEFVFNILSATKDEVVLESKLDFGDDITILTLKRATPADLDFAPILESLSNLSGEITNSVFRNILINDELVGDFSFDENTRLATVRYVNENGEIITETSPIGITPEGFFFIKPIDVKGTLLTSFVPSETDDDYVNLPHRTKITYSNLPAFTSNAIRELSALDNGNPVFLYRPELGRNPLTSKGHDVIVDELNEFLSQFDISFFEYIFFFDFNDDGEICEGQLRIRFNGFGDLNYCFSATKINDDNTFEMTFQEPLDQNSVDFQPLAQDFIDFFNSSSGMVTTSEGTFESDTNSFSNSAVTFTSLENPSLRVYGVLL